MYNLSAYILEKLHLNKNINIKSDNMDKLLFDLESYFDGEFLYKDDDYEFIVDDDKWLYIKFKKEKSSSFLHSCIKEIKKKFFDNDYIDSFFITFDEDDLTTIYIHDIEFKNE